MPSLLQTRFGMFSARADRGRPGLPKSDFLSINQSFAQAHLFDSYHQNCPHFDELDPVPVGRFLYGDLCRTMGYSGLGGDTPESVLRLETHERLGALPSLEVRKPDDVLKPSPAVRRVLDRAKA
jgi:hypothetical protein